MSIPFDNSAKADKNHIKVDVIIPVYRGLEETRTCIESVLSNPQSAKFELIVIDDCSPEPALAAWLEHMAEVGKFTLLKNPCNVGFVQTVNRGMSLHPDRDVILLNSDAIVANDWLDRLHICAHANELIAIYRSLFCTTQQVGELRDHCVSFCAK